MGKEMDLKIHILARGEEAIKCIKRVRDDIAGLSSAVGKVGSIFFAPLRLAAGGIMVLGTAITGLAAKSLAAAAADEKLQQRLIGVFGSVEKGKKAFEDIEAIARRSWLPVEDMVQARIIMKGFGLDSERNLGATANAARAAGTGVAEMAKAISVLQVRSLKAFGIEINSDDGKFVARWRNQLGQIQTATTKTADQMRVKLMDVMAMRFGTSFRPKGLSEFWSMFKNNVDQVFSNIGAPMLDAATRFVAFLSEKLSKLIESGQLEEWGKKIGKWMDDAATNLQAAFETAPELFAALEKNVGAIPGILKEAMGGLGQILMSVLYEAFSASTSLWTGIGKTIGMAIAQAFAESGLPGSGMAKDLMIKKAITDLVENGGALSAKRELGITDFTKMTPKQESDLMGYSAKKSFTSGLSDLQGAGPNAIAGVQAVAGTVIDALSKKIRETTGFDSADTFRKEKQKILDQREADKKAKEEMVEMALVRAHRRRLVSRSNAGEENWSNESIQTLAEPGEYKLGQKVGGGGKVSNLIVNLYRKDDVKRIQNGMKAVGWLPPLSLAGG